MIKPESAPDVLIRRALKEESFTIASILREAFVEFELLYSPSAFAVTTPTPDQIQMRWNEGPVWLAAQGKHLVGTVAAISKSVD